MGESGRPAADGQPGVEPDILELLEALNLAAAVLDAEARVLAVTSQLQELPDFRQCRIGQRPRHRDGETEERIRSYLRAEVAKRSAPRERPPLLVHGERRRPLVVKAVPMRGSLPGAAEAVALILDLETSPAPSPQALRQIFRFTNAEARVASRIAAGGSISELARALGVSVGTVRQHLKAIFAKTGCRRQSELLALLARLSLLKLAGPESHDGREPPARPGSSRP